MFTQQNVNRIVMALRRISDLPELFTNNPNAELSNCLIEVSYRQPDNYVYESYFVNLYNVLSSFYQKMNSN